MSLKIGVMVPRSDMYPALGMDFLNGVKLALAESGMPEPQFFVEGIGNATDKTLIKTAEKLVLQEDVDITLSFCSYFILNELVDLYNSYQKLLLHVDLGGNILKKQHISPYVAHLTLNMCQSAFEAGIWAAENLGKKGFAAVSFYDGAYQMTASFVEGFNSKGGEICGFHVGSSDYKEDDPQQLIDRIEEESPDFVFAAYSFNEGKGIFDALAKSDLNGKLPIMAIPTMTDESIVKENLKVQGVVSVASWSFDDELDSMTSFNEKYEESHGKTPNIMALLGYEAGLLIDANGKDGQLKLPNGFDYAMRITSPRGEVRFNSFGESETPVHKLRKFEYNETKYHNNNIEVLTASQFDEMYQKFEDIQYTGWMNPYICT